MLFAQRLKLNVTNQTHKYSRLDELPISCLKLNKKSISVGLMCCCGQLGKEITAIHLIRLCQAESWAGSQTQSPSTGPLNMQALPEKLKPCQPSTLLRLPDVYVGRPLKDQGSCLVSNNTK